MKKILLTVMLLSVFVACKKEGKTTDTEVTEVQTEEVNYMSFGEEIIADDAVSAVSMAEHYKAMHVGDSIHSKMIAKVDEVCQAKGCWMKLNLENGEQVMVKFKDYGFFMPKNIAGQEVIVNGKAYVNEVSVEELRHYAEDAGKSAEEIALITMPKKTYSFEADGVLLVEE
ncbi:uncharacterized protein DUF4920 [Oceanihabitans sediminis]|uniref:DUF4920 domain-containing protein n=1 Tax=Oceanihabitans sediminis TaxID=1812012 RepID=A0A368P6E1_9FLAO|nr:DUF4920 domain-containing protein [Oceanihabitans sediminis]RBP30899.1 uncharacterized protein DUF4920 [Oceanihabitans sediminis]RCU56861.1 DUF4920 domain-containing protein [Oceanihabitans sediminis]